MTDLYVAAGGGGDVLAAAMLHAARGMPDRPVIATYGWDRLLVDPLPGPRSADAFTGLERITAHLHAVTADTRPIPPAGSTLPRLADDLDAVLLLLDPHHGARGLHRQLADAVEHFRSDGVTIVDVGGDVVARGDEPSLKSPTADLLALTAAAMLAESGIDARVAVLGPGLDGELPAVLVRERIAALGGAFERHLHARDTAPIEHALTWHPSEASGMLAAAAAGARGAAEIRDAGTQIQLDAQSTEVYRLAALPLADDCLLTARLRGTADFTGVENAVHEVCGRCETDYERRKADALRTDLPQPPDPAAVEQRVHQVERFAAARGSDYITLRRLAEQAGTPRGTESYAAWRAALIERRPHRYRTPPLWAVHDHASAAH